MPTDVPKDQADRSLDTYAERIVRNEGRLEGHMEKVASDRDSDRKITDQRAQSLADELERRADNLVTLSENQRAADLLEMRNRFGSEEKARKLQAREYKRRLTNLNGEHKRIAAIQSRSVTRELFDAELRSVRDGIDNLKGIIHADVEAARQINAQRIAVLEAAVDTLKLAESKQGGKALGRGELIALVVSLFAVLTGVIIVANFLASR